MFYVYIFYYVASTKTFSLKYGKPAAQLPYRYIITMLVTSIYARDAYANFYVDMKHYRLAPNPYIPSNKYTYAFTILFLSKTPGHISG